MLQRMLGADKYNEWLNYLGISDNNDPNIINQLEMSFFLEDDTGVDSHAKIKKGGTAPGVFGFDLTDLETPVVLQVKDFKGLIYEQEFPIK